MRTAFILLLLSLLTLSCQQAPEKQAEPENKTVANKKFTLVFASCNDQEDEQPLWRPILETKPEVFIWGGDNIYADTEDMAKMKADYDRTYNRAEYAQLRTQAYITGTWDDHDYGVNDGGKEYPKKQEAKQLMLDFLDVALDDPRRSRDGAYHSEVIEADGGSIKLILLDTRTFRDSLLQSQHPNRRYDAWTEAHNGTILGEQQWTWLEEELQDDAHDFTLIVSSIQVLSKEHGWESWANFSGERKRLLSLIDGSKANNLIILSGDRHHGEVSLMHRQDKPALIDFTSSGMTFTYLTSGSEDNQYRISNVVKQLNFGVLQFDFQEKTVLFEIRGKDNFIYERHLEQY